MIKKWVMVVCCAAVVNGFAEMREWTDTKGNKIEAEFKGVSGKKILLVNEKEKEFKVSLESLSKKDQEYLQGKIPDSLLRTVVDAGEKPPQLELEFKKLTDSTTSNDNYYRNVDTVGKVVVTKKSRDPYSCKLKSVLFVIGFNDYDDKYIILDKKEHEFSFESEDEVVYQGNHFVIQEYTSEYESDVDNTTEYNGYLVVVLDESGKVLEKKASSSLFEKNYAKLSKFNVGNSFTKKFETQSEARKVY